MTIFDAADNFIAGKGSPVEVRLAPGVTTPARLWRGWLFFERSSCIDRAARHQIEVPVQRFDPAPYQGSHRWPGCDAPRVRLQLLGSTPFNLNPDLGSRAVPVREGGDRWK